LWWSREGTGFAECRRHGLLYQPDVLGDCGIPIWGATIYFQGRERSLGEIAVRLIEHEAKLILRARGFEIPRGILVRTAEEIDHALAAVPLPVMVKAQVPIGGRGNAGAVVRAADATAARGAIIRLLGSSVRGYPVEGVLLETFLDVHREFYVGFTYDPAGKQAILLASAAGGVDVEVRARTEGEPMTRRAVVVRRELYGFEGREVAAALGLEGRNLVGFGSALQRGWDSFLGLDCTLLEINPLALTADGRFVVADARLEVDDDALFRQERLEKSYGIPRREASGRLPTALERQAAEIDGLDHRGVAGRVIEFDGDLGLLIGGGGASLTAFDAIRRHGGRPANYSEVGGNPSVRKVAALTRLLLAQPRVARLAVIMNVVSNTRVDLIARGVIQGILEAGREPAATIAVFRVPGSWEEEGIKLLRRYGVAFCDRRVSIDEAARLAVRASRA